MDKNRVKVKVMPVAKRPYYTTHILGISLDWVVAEVRIAHPMETMQAAERYHCRRLV